jgi:16S rRNA (uracil1498-N3)-methyltransferase
MADRFYINCPLGPGPVLLQGTEAHHLLHVLRARPGHQVILFNGDGHEYLAEVASVAKRELELIVKSSETPARELGFRLIVAAPVPKGDRAQFLIEKLTELGATSFVPVRTARSVIEPREAKLERFERYVIEASKQCGRNVLMAIEPLADWGDFCRRHDLPVERWLAHPGGDNPRKGQDDVALAIGPEGGFTEEEQHIAKQSGWQFVGLGPRILRMETAAMAMTVLAALS